MDARSAISSGQVAKNKSLQDARLISRSHVTKSASIGPPFAFLQVQSILAGDRRM